MAGEFFVGRGCFGTLAIVVDRLEIKDLDQAGAVPIGHAVALGQPDDAVLVGHYAPAVPVHVADDRDHPGSVVTMEPEDLHHHRQVGNFSPIHAVAEAFEVALLERFGQAGRARVDLPAAGVRATSHRNGLSTGRGRGAGA